MTQKYIFINGIMKLNPDYEKPSGGTSSPEDQQQLAVVSSLDDMLELQQVYCVEIENPDEQKKEIHGMNMDNCRTIMEEEEYVGSYSSTEGSLFDQLVESFVKYEVPIGLMYKLLELRNYRLHFLLDDSGSMLCESDAPWTEATEYIPRTGESTNMTRILEEENRLHIFMDILAYIPTKGIRLLFMNSPLDITLVQGGRSPAEFKAEAHSTIRNAFANLRFGATPTYRLLSKSLNDARAAGGWTHHYLLTDGVPSDMSAHHVGKLIEHRQNPAANPVTLISCTNVDSECEWMKDIEEIAPYTSECDDYHDEKREVLKDQGPALPYTRGFWLIAGLVAAMNPHDLDAMDESIPLTRFTLNELLGRTHSAAEYQHYWSLNPHHAFYQDKFERFLSDQCHAAAIVPKEQQKNYRAPRNRATGGDECCTVM